MAAGPWETQYLSVPSALPALQHSLGLFKLQSRLGVVLHFWAVWRVRGMAKAELEALGLRSLGGWGRVGWGRGMVTYSQEEAGRPGFMRHWMETQKLSFSPGTCPLFVKH